MTYEQLLVRAIHEALIEFVRDHREDGVEGVELAKDGGMVKAGGEWSLAVKVSRLAPVAEGQA